MSGICPLHGCMFPALLGCPGCAVFGGGFGGGFPAMVPMGMGPGPIGMIPMTMGAGPVICKYCRIIFPSFPVSGNCDILTDSEASYHEGRCPRSLQRKRELQRRKDEEAAAKRREDERLKAAAAKRREDERLKAAAAKRREDERFEAAAAKRREDERFEAAAAKRREDERFEAAKRESDTLKRRVRVGRSSISMSRSSLMSCCDPCEDVDPEMQKKAKKLSEKMISTQPFRVEGLKFEKLLTQQPTGQAVVFEGKFRSQNVAIKFFLSGGTDEEIQRLKNQEAGSLHAIGSHPHIISCLHHTDYPWPIIVMPFLQILPWRNRAMNEVLVKQYAKQLAYGLSFMHSRNIAHLDIKLDNTLLDSRGNLLITDFGMASSFTGNDEIDCKGTPPFMAPEAIMDFGFPTSRAKVDCFAFAMTVWQMFTGKIPWEEIATGTTLEIYCGNLRENLKSNKRPQLSPRWNRRLVAAMEQCWEYQPENRPDMSNIVRSLSSI
jgi:hypothetical protein